MLMRSLAVVAALASCSAVAGCASADASDVPEEDDAALTSALTGTLAAGTKLKTTANLNFRSSPEISTNVLRVVPKGTELLAVGGDAQNGFYAVTHGGRTGFASAKHLALATAASPSSGTSAGGTPSAGPASADFRVTYIGDSHSDYGGNAHASFGFLGEHVVERMTASGIPISLFAASASSPNWWFDDTPTQAATWGYTQTSPTPPRRSCSRGGQSGPCVPKLSAILSDHPSLFVIEQGTNLFGRSRADVTNQIKTMLRQIEGKTDACLWLGAPNASTSAHSQESQDELWQLIAEHAGGRCFVMDSRMMPRVDASGVVVHDAQGNLVMDVPLPYGGSDGEHFAAAGAGKWADGVATMIEFIRDKRR